jgi:hypothetical protein
MSNHDTWANRRRSTLPGTEMGGGVNMDAAAIECSMEELQEFLEADLGDVKADVEFKESLRDRLWSMVERRNRMRVKQLRRR